MKTVAGINYSLPAVTLLQQTGIGTAEYAARTCYDSFESSENACVTSFNRSDGAITPDHLELINDIEHSNLLDQLAWTHFHYSILEHINLTYLIKGTSRGVLQEHARHRIQAISVRSTRYTMSSIINAFVASLSEHEDPRSWFIEKTLTMDLFVTSDEAYNRIELMGVFNKLFYQYNLLQGNDPETGVFEFFKTAVAKSSLVYLEEAKPAEDMFQLLEAGKKKRNVADNFKHVVTDNFKVDMVVTFNLRSLKNYIELRSSGAAWFQIQWLAEEMIKATPKKYLDLIVKRDKLDKILKET